MSPVDDEIEGLFADLRAEEMARAPRFSTLRIEPGRNAAVLKRSAPIGRVWWLAAAASAVIATTILTRHVRHDLERVDPHFPDVAPYPSIESWSAPTDALLRRAEGTIAAPPGTFRSVLDGLTTAARSFNSYK